MRSALPLLIALAPPAAAQAAMPTVAAMRDHARVLIVASPTLGDARLAAQRRALAGWRRGARDRDLMLVTVTGNGVTGAGDHSKVLRRAWHLPPDTFQVVLVGKNGHEALRSRQPLSARTLQRTVDAMPMRSAGRR